MRNCGRIIAICFFGGFFAGCEQKFDSAKWKAERGMDSGDMEYRPDIAETVIDQFVKVGASRVEIERALGPSDGTAPKGEAYYCLGFPPLVGWDPEYLILVYDENGKLVRWEIEQG